MGDNRIGKAIAVLRRRAGYTQKDLADRIGISDKAVSKWERGLGLPDIGYLRRLSILLDTDTDTLLAGGIQHDTKWQGIILLDQREYPIGIGQIIYDKPLINILLSYFILVGIQDVLVVCSEEDAGIIRSVIGDGSSLGIHVRCVKWGDWEITECSRSANQTMLLYGRCLLYGVDQTRFFQRAMAHRAQLTTLVLPKKGENKELSICVDEHMKIVNSNEVEPIRKQYDYSMLPFLFFPAEMLVEILNEGHPSRFITKYAQQKEMYVEMMDRGFVEFEMNDWESVQDASGFLRIVQDKCGMNVYCIEEVAWRRGFISLEQLRRLGEKQKNTEYGRYILSLCERVEKPSERD